MSSTQMKRSMRPLLEQYGNLRGKRCEPGAMWDAVVLTTIDGVQKEAYQQQIEEKEQRGELPLNMPIHVVSDPPGPRIGNGGSTLVALEFLHAQYGEVLSRMRVLLVHAGGWSQRMPSAALLGKAFAAIPHGAPPLQMLDVKIAGYLPLLPRMPPGVMLVCADDFVVYHLGPEDLDWSIPSRGVTALAHPSPLAVGRSHGVYVVGDAEKVDPHSPVVMAQCLEVLQKPSDQRMKDRGALLKSPSGVLEFCDGIRIEGDCVYTDSCFFMAVDMVQRLLTLKQGLGDLDCEIDAYGDFLQALGPRASDDYVHLTANISQMTEKTIQVRRRVYEAIRGAEIHLLLMNASQFGHIGTTGELIQAFCQDAAFRQQLALDSDTFNCWLPANMSDDDSETSNGKSADTFKKKISNSSDSFKNNSADRKGEQRHCADGENQRKNEGDENKDKRKKKNEGNMEGGDGRQKEGGKGEEKVEKEGCGDPASLPKGCAMHSVLRRPSCLAAACVVEYCHFDVPVTVPHNTIVSNCQWLASAVSNNNADCDFTAAAQTEHGGLQLPSDTFLHTAAISFEGSTHYVTVFFHTADNLKKSSDVASLGGLPFLGVCVRAALQQWGLEEKHVNPHHAKNPPLDKVSLWTLKLFPAASTMTQSLRLALDMVGSLREGRALCSPIAPSSSTLPLFSLAEVLKHKDLTAMLGFRRSLYDLITASRDMASL